ncbi:MAG: hypothetical protein JNL98_14150 [Bryobacterales bacterium]|nr:hypothetical protein [Bryobacterales bacterium]
MFLTTDFIPNKESQVANEGTLYVVVHGLVTLVKRKDGKFHGYFVEMPEHEYLAGSWLNERPIPDRTVLELEGVREGTADWDREKNLVVKVQSDLDKAGVGLRRVILPAPKVLHPVFTQDISANLVGDLSGLSSKNLSVKTVFEYEVERFRDVRLTGRKHARFWQPAIRRVQPADNAVAVLHLFDEPRRMPSRRNHFTDEFKKTFVLLGWQSTGINDTIDATQARRQPTPCPGIHRREFHDLVTREKVAARLAQMLLNPDPGDASMGVGGEPAVCGGGKGCEECG